MTDDTAPPATETAPPATETDRALMRTHRPSPWLVGGVGFLIMAGAVTYAGAITHVWLQSAPAADSAAIEQRLVGIDSRLTGLEQRPMASGTTDLGPLIARLNTLEQRPRPDLASLQARIAELEQHPGGDVASLTARLAAVEKSTAQSEQLGRVQAASAALATGQALGHALGQALGRGLGAMADAPPALARFATAKPPTDATLRLSFPIAERAALLASRPEQDDRPLLDRILARAAGLVTIRQGDRVLVGDPAAGVLARASRALDAGDLSGAIAALSALHGASAEAMTPWIADATALRDARLALAELAERR